MEADGLAGDAVVIAHFLHAGGVFHVAPRVELSCETEDGTIIYTTERVAPFHWRLHTGPFRMRFWTLRFQCGRLGYRDSDVVTYNFDIE